MHRVLVIPSVPSVLARESASACFDVAVEVPVAVRREDDASDAIKLVRLAALVADFPDDFAIPFADHPVEIDGNATCANALDGNLHPACRHVAAICFRLSAATQRRAANQDRVGGMDVPGAASSGDDRSQRPAIGALDLSVAQHQTA